LQTERKLLLLLITGEISSMKRIFFIIGALVLNAGAAFASDELCAAL
jgi:hypothetical protein